MISRSFFLAFSLMVLATTFPLLSLANEKESNIFGIQMDKDGYISIPKEGNNNIDKQKQNALIKAYEKQQQDFIKQQKQKLKESYR